MKPLLMMRTRGLSGPAFANHHGIKGLSKSAGTFIGLDNGPDETTVAVPDVFGLQYAPASTIIFDAGLIPVKAGTGAFVFEQDPIAGTIVELGSQVVLTLQDI